MRILDVASVPSVPTDRGGTVRIHSLLRHLSRRHELRQFCLGYLSRPYRQAVKEIPISPTYRVVSYASPLTVAAIGLSVRVSKSRSIGSRAAIRFMRPQRLERLAAWADLVLLEGPWLIEAARRLGSRHLVVAMHNVETARFASYAEARGRSIGTGRLLRKIEWLQASALASASLVTTVSERDRLELVERYGADPARTVVVPNGADTERYHPVDRDTKESLKRELGLPAKPLVIYVGSRFPPNEVGLSWVRRAAKAADRFTFLVVGAVSRPGVSGNVVAKGVVPDVAPYLHAADFAICPVQYGGGTKIKLFESLAAGLPTVVFPESLRGTAFVDGEHVLAAGKNDADLAACLELLAHDVDLADRIGAQARALVVAQHDWRRSAAVLDAALRNLTGEREHRLTYRAPARSASPATIL